MQDLPENHFGERNFLGKYHDLFIYLEKPCFHCNNAVQKI